MTVPKPARLRIDNLPTVFPNAAGLDIGSAEIVAEVKHLQKRAKALGFILQPMTA